MSDEEYFEQLCSNSLDGTLTDSESEKLEAHLAECPSCAALREDMEQMRALFAEEAEPPEGLHEGITQRLEQESKLKVVQPEKPVRRMPVFTMVAAAAVVVLVVLGGGLLPMFSTVTRSDVTAEGMPADSAAAGDTDMSAVVKGAAEDAGVTADVDAGASEETAQASGGAGSTGAALYSAQTQPPVSAEPHDAAGTEEDTQTDGSAQDSQQSVDAATITPGSSGSKSAAAESADAPAAMTAGSEVQAVEVPESLRAMTVSHCYLAQGGGELPDIGGELLATDNEASWFLLDNNLTTLQDTLDAVENAGYTVASYEEAGLTIDSKASSWILVVVNG